MIEETILELMIAALDVPILTELPAVPSEMFPEWPDEFVTIERVGAGKTNHIQTTSIAFQSHSLTSLYNAALLDEKVRKAVEGFITNNTIASVRLSSNYNHTDTRTKRYRYQCVYDITHY